MQFLTCIESSLLPYGMLEPPLWSERRQKEEMKINSTNDQRQSSIPKDSKNATTSEKQEIKTSDAEKTVQAEDVSKGAEEDSKSSTPKKPKRMFPSFSFRKKEVKIPEDIWK